MNEDQIRLVARQTAVSFLTDDVTVDYHDFFNDAKVNQIKLKQQFEGLDLTIVLVILTTAKMAALKMTEEFLENMQN